MAWAGRGRRLGQQPAEVIVELDNACHTDGGGWHNFVLEGQNLEQRVPPKQSGTVSFVLSQLGEYLFYCDICCGGKDNPFMRGKVVVSS